MDKAQAIHQFWSRFGTAYDENTVPDDAQMPYITYSVDTGSLEDVLTVSGDLWERSTSWEGITKKAQEIADYIGPGGRSVKIDNGYMYLCRGNPFSQRMADDGDNVRRIYLIIQIEFLTQD